MTEINNKTPMEKMTIGGNIYEVKNITPEFDKKENRHLYGFTVKTDKKTFSSVLKYSYHQSFFVVKTVFISFVDLLTGRLSRNEVSGPVGIVNEIGNAASDCILPLLYLAALLSLNLGVMNLLPFPALDGCRLLFVIIEFIRRKPIPKEKEGIVHAIGFIILMLFMLYITFFDVVKLFK